MDFVGKSEEQVGGRFDKAGLTGHIRIDNYASLGRDLVQVPQYRAFPHAPVTINDNRIGVGFG